MGVTGLWRLIEPSGKPVPLETLENKVLAVDISIWLHQAIKGFRDARGGSIPNAHLLGIYHRVCKLLYFKIKPIFVFDGGVPHLKRETIARRQQQKSKTVNDVDRIQKQLLDTLLKHSAVSKVIAEKVKSNIEATTTTSPTKSTYSEKSDNLYQLPELDSTLSSDDSSDIDSSASKHWDLHAIDETSHYFKSLPPDVRHEILTELKATRKQSSWGIIHQMPKESGQFSNFQMKRLLKRYSVQASLEEAEKEMGGCSLSLAELESLLNAQGVVTNTNSVGSRIASDENTRYLYIKDVKKTLEEARRQETLKNRPVAPENESAPIEETEKNEATDVEYENDLQKAIELSMQDVPSTSKDNLSFLDQSHKVLLSSSSDSETEDDERSTRLKNAKSYMTEYSGLTPHEIAKIIGSDSKNKRKNVSSKKSAREEAIRETIPNVEVNLPDAAAVATLSDSDSSDLCEVTSTENYPAAKAPFQVLIKTDETLEDDIFSDVFAEKTGNDLAPTSTNEATFSPEQIPVVADQAQSANHAQSENANKHTEIVVLDKQCEEVELEEQIEMINGNNKPQEKESGNETPVRKSSKEKSADHKLQKNTDSIEKEATAPIRSKQRETVLTTKQLSALEQDMNDEVLKLRAEKSAKERLATDLTDQVYQEAQDLLELFGIPYIIAPMEAEAQCGFLDHIGLIDGTITDDSDIWLFGGKTVYKNFFDQQKHVLQFTAEDIQRCFKLTREQMILLALLVGSDYTAGIQGVGPVTALEILSVFPPAKECTEVRFPQAELLSGLRDFRKWLMDGRTATTSLSLRSKLKNVAISETFPSVQVVNAYLDPTVDSSNEPFSWGKPHMNLLIDFAKEKFAWTQAKSESILKPVFKRLDDSHIQKSIKDYFKTKHNVTIKATDIKLSKRVKKALDNLDKDETVSSSSTKIKGNRSRRKRTTDKPDGEESKPEQNANVAKIRRNAQSLKNANAAPKPQKSTKRKIEVKAANESLKRMLNEENIYNVEDLAQDEDVQVLRQSCSVSESRMEEIENIPDSVKKQEEKPKVTINLHKKEFIPQRERDKSVALRSKLKAIEVFRKSKLGAVKKRKKGVNLVKDDAGLSESSSGSD